jgi:hypothetical protein
MRTVEEKAALKQSESGLGKSAIGVNETVDESSHHIIFSGFFELCVYQHFNPFCFLAISLILSESSYLLLIYLSFYIISPTFKKA